MSRDIVWFSGEVKTPPFSYQARQRVGMLLRRLQDGDRIDMPHSRRMRSIGKRVHELRVNDEAATWRLIYRVDSDAIVVLDVFAKKSQRTTRRTIAACKRRIKIYDSI